jgi:hypothetical protein
VLFIYGIKFRVWPFAVLAPLAHLTAALVTLTNFQDEGCTKSVPVVLSLGAGTGVLAARVMWKTGMARRPLAAMQESMMHGVR